MGRPSTDAVGEGSPLRLALDIWHPDCWTLRVTERREGGFLGHGVHEVDGRAVGRFTAFGDTTDAVADLVAVAEESPLTSSVKTVPDRRRSPVDGVGPTAAPGNAARGLLVTYDPANSVAAPLASRGFIPDAPVRIRDGRERWAVVTDGRRETVRDRLDAVRTEADADVDVVRVTAPGAASSSLFLDDPLSDRQREVLEAARERGYYERPRRVSAADLAEELGVSKATALEHLRKAEAKLLDPR